MPRRGENIYKRKDGRWEGRVLNKAGKYQYVYAQSYKEVKEKQKLLLRGGGGERPVCALSAAARLEAWLDNELPGRVKPSTYESYYRCVTKYILPFFREAGNEGFSEPCMEEFMRRTENSGAISETYKRKILSIFKTALRDILRGRSDCAPLVAALRLPKSSGAIVEVFSVREQRAVEMASAGDPDSRSLGILLCFYTGLRLGELCALKWSDFDPDAGVMTVSRTVSRVKNFQAGGAKTSLLVGTPKSHKSVRVLPLPDFLIRLFGAHQALAASADSYVLTDSDTPMEPRTMQKLFKRLLRQAGVKPRKFHAIRHTFATRALELGVDIKTLSEMLGHANVSITLNIYAHSLLDQKKRAMDKFNQMYLTYAESPAIAVQDAVTPAQ